VLVQVLVLVQAALRQALTWAQTMGTRVAMGYLQAAQQASSQVPLAQVRGCHALID